MRTSKSEKGPKRNEEESTDSLYIAIPPWNPTHNETCRCPPQELERKFVAGVSFTKSKGSSVSLENPSREAEGRELVILPHILQSSYPKKGSEIAAHKTDKTFIISFIHPYGVPERYDY